MRVLFPEPFWYTSRKTKFAIWNITDVHIGHSGCNERQFRADIERIRKDPLAFWGGGGDYIDAIIHKDPRFMATSVAPMDVQSADIITSQINRFCAMIEPIADKCLWLLGGNHEDAILKHNGNDAYGRIVGRIARMKGVSPKKLALGWEGMIRLSFRRGVPDSFSSSAITIYTHHGAGGGRKLGAHGLRIEEVMGSNQADLYLMGHRHVRSVHTKPVNEIVGKKSILRERVGVWCGSYLGSSDDGKSDIPPSSYVKAKQLPALKTGLVPVIIKPDVKQFFPLIGNGDIGAIYDDMRGGS